MKILVSLAAAPLLAAFAFAAEAPEPVPATPIRHIVVLFQENVSFDHYFATYPNAENKPGETPFFALPGTPTVNGLTRTLLDHNPNSAPPVRLDRAHAATCDQDHGYIAEQKAADHGLMDKFVEFTGDAGDGCDSRLVMDYFDGNTVAALWNYAQHFAMSDDSFDTLFGPSTPGAVDLVSGQTHGAVPAELEKDGEILVASGTVISDADPEYDDCSKAPVFHLTGVNVGDLLNRAGVTWGWFEGGFRPTGKARGKAVCGAAHEGSDGKRQTDYIPHHEPFQYYKSTANPRHLKPSSTASIGRTDRANHQYDLADFWKAADAGNLPAVSFLKAPGYQDGHAGYSDPVHEQAYLVETLNRLQKLPEWRDTAVVISYDDSDGWYDHAMPPVVNDSSLPGIDALTGPGACGAAAPGAHPGRCGYGARLPLLVVSPYAKENFVDHSLTDQTSILRFIEDNWRLGRIGDQSFDALAGPLGQFFDFAGDRRAPALLLDPATGARQRADAESVPSARP
ncbi:MAG TPA: alkaline phosphatase family protein [Elusimicrobiota bacterium]|jgi:phospholipase C|nr:alkaline phosphatase family protein [Elusimicrobiota bacterium]